MSTTTSNRLPWILVTLLVALNFLVLILVWFKPPPPPPPRPGEGRPGPGGLAREIGMTEPESEKLKPLQEAHFAQLDAYQQEIVKFRQEAFAEFGKPDADSAAAMAALEKVGAAQIAIEKERYRHFYEVLAICTPEEATRFQELMPKLLSRRNQPENDPHRGGRGEGPPR
jgi:Spy/CpxP family protein refolding chaperone